MSFTLVAYSDQRNITSSFNMSGLTDQHLTINGVDVIVPDLNNIAGYYVVGSNVTTAQLTSPSLRRMFNIDVEPLDVNITPITRPPFIDLFDTPVALDKAEALNFSISNLVNGGVRTTALVWLSDGKPPVKSTGKIFTVRVNGTTTLTAQAWTAVPLTFTQTLPAGRYAIVGVRAQVPGGLAARLVFPGGGWRPGVICQGSDVNFSVERFRGGNAGSFGEFEHNSPPQIEVLGVSADTIETFHLDLMQVRSGSAK